MLPIIPNINIDSDFHKLDNNRSNLEIKFQESIHIDKKIDGKRLVKINSMKLPMTVYNINLGINDTLRYSMNAGGAYSVITLSPGIYSFSAIDENIKKNLYDNGHTELDPITNEIIYPFVIQVNSSTNKGYIVIDTNHSLYASVIVDLTNNTTSTFYLIYGFLLSEAVLDGSISTIQISTNNSNIFDSSFIVECSIVKSYTISTNQSIKDSRIIYKGTLDGVPNGYVLRKSTDDIYGELFSYDFSSINIRFLDRYGKLLVFNDNSLDSNVEISLSIY